MKFAESIAAKIKTDPVTFDAKQAYMAQFDPVEKIIIEKSRLVRGKYYDIWSPD